MSKIGIVTVLYNSESVLQEFFDSLERQTYKDFTLYVIDNASSDNSLEKCMELSQKSSFNVKYYPEKTNWGIAKGNNIGIENALNDGCEYVLLSNNDIVLKEDAIEELFHGIGNDLSMTASKIYYHGSNKLWFAGGDFGCFGRIIHFGDKKEDTGLYNEPRLIKYAPTCFILIHRNVFDEVGLMDEKYFVYYDDCDFIYRATIKKGIKLKYIPSSIIHHKIGISSGGRLSQFTLGMLGRNSVYFVRKNYKFPYKQIGIIWQWLNVYVRYPLKLKKPSVPVLSKAFREGMKMRT